MNYEILKNPIIKFAKWKYMRLTINNLNPLLGNEVFLLTDVHLGISLIAQSLHWGPLKHFGLLTSD